MTVHGVEAHETELFQCHQPIMLQGILVVHPVQPRGFPISSLKALSTGVISITARPCPLPLELAERGTHVQYHQAPDSGHIALDSNGGTTDSGIAADYQWRLIRGPPLGLGRGALLFH